jgi:hypothetical protein
MCTFSPDHPLITIFYFFLLRRKKMKKKFCIAMVLVCTLSLAAYADEMDPIEPSIGLMWGEDGTGNTWMDGMNDTEFVPNGDDSFTLIAGTALDPMELTGCEISLTMTYDPDPYVDAVFGVKNTLLVDQTFTFTFTSPVSPALTPSTLFQGTMSGSVTADGTAGSLSTSGVALYQGFIDSDLVLEFYEDPYSLAAAAGESPEIPGVVTSGPQSGPAADSTIEMTYTFTLSPGELASINGIFLVEVVPEPATMVLLGLGAVLLRRRKR